MLNWKIVFLFIFSLGCSLKTTKLPPNCDFAAHKLACYKTSEKSYLKFSGAELVKRNKEVLEILEDSKNVFRYTNVKDKYNSIAYYYQGFDPDLKQHLIRYVLREGGGFFFVNPKNDQKTSIDSKPILSANKKRALTYSLDIDAGYEPNRIQVYQVTPSELVLEFSFQPSANLTDTEELWGPKKVFWESNESFLVEKEVLGTSGYLSAGQIRFQFENGKWEEEKVE